MSAEVANIKKAGIETAVVVKIEGEFAHLVPSTPESCDHCALKELCIGNTEGKLKALNPARAREGDFVEFEINVGLLNKRLIIISFLGLTLLFAGALIGYYLNPFKINPSLSGGIFALTFTLFIIPIVKGKRYSSEDLYPVIKRVIRRKI